MSTPVHALRSHAYAHTIIGRSELHWEPLEKHLDDVALLGARFASNFGAADWGYILGRCHDLGKYSDEFQQYPRLTQDPDAGAVDGLPDRVDHSTWGARYAAEKVGKHKGQMLAPY
jgi:CRISPR-associated endonuclease/helicase Cas3